MFKLNKTQNSNLVRVSSLAIFLVILLSVSNLFATTYYSKAGSSDPASRSSWNTQRDGSGITPTSSTIFTNGNTFIIQYNHSMIMSNSWTLSGNGALLIIERNNNTNATLTLDLSSSECLSVVDLQIDGNLVVKSGSASNTDSVLVNGGSFTKGANSSISSYIRLGLSGSPSTSVMPSLTLYRLTLNRSNGVNLNGNVTIINSLFLTNGVINTGNYSVIFASTALNPTETNGKRIDGYSVMEARTIGTGSYTFLGAYFAAASQSLGTVTITRKSGNSAVVSNGISCEWDIDAQNQPTNGRNMSYTWFNSWDNAHTFGNGNKGQVYYSTDNGASWSAIGDLVEPVIGGSNTTRTMTVSTTHYSQWTISSQDSPLPVTLSSFTSSVKNNSVTLNWSTSSEINNKGFEVERKEANSSNYTKVGFVDGKGTTNQVSNYSFSDSKLNTGKYSYRIKQIDFNGNFEYFSLNSGIEIGAPKKFTLSQNYPNPFNPTTKIDYEIPADSKVNITIYDISGKEVQQVVNENQKAGFYTAQFNAGNLSSGTYFYKLTSGNNILTKKMTLIK